MTGYEIYGICRHLRHWKVPSYDTFKLSNESGYYNFLAEHLKLIDIEDKDVRSYIKANWLKNPDTFDPFSLSSEEAKKIYFEWKLKSSDKNIYFNEVIKSFNFIENFCLKNKINFSQYKSKYGMKHVRESKIDFAIAVFHNFIDINNLNHVEKLVFKNYFRQYNNIKIRLTNSELKNLIETKTQEMNDLLSGMVPTKQAEK